jgi:putative ABC transport system permease protein
MSGFRRLGALAGLAVRRVVGRLRTSPARVGLSVVGVALAVGLVVSVCGISVGLASESVVGSEGTDYWVVPEDANVQSLAVSTGGVTLGDVHDASARIETDDRVEYAVPVLLELLPFEDADTGERTYVLVAGVVARPEVELLGMALGPLTPGDPYYADGSYDGTWTGEAVLNEAAATSLNASTGTTLGSPRLSHRSLSVVNVTAGATTATGSVPVAVVHLSELQAVSGAATGDQADQILVNSDDRSVRRSLEGVYPRTKVVRRSGLAAQRVSASNLPLAIAISGAATAVLVGVLFVATLMGLAVSEDSESLGTLAAIGLSRRSRSFVVAVETVTVALMGGLCGLVLGVLGILTINATGKTVLGLEPVATFHTLLAWFAVGVALLIGILGAAYPVFLSRRLNPLEAISR